LDIFSDRSYEWWEAGSKSNCGIKPGNGKGNKTDSKRDYSGDYANGYPTNCSSSLDNNYSHFQYRHSYEDEFSQEVLYDD